MTTMTMLEQIKAAAALAAQTADNMTESVAGGGGQESRILKEGYCLMRLIELTEYGTQPQNMKGKAVEPAPEIQLGFACFGPGVQNEDGTPYIIRPWSMKVSRNEKANAFLLFQALNWKGTATCWPQLVGETFMGFIETYTPDAAQTALGKKPVSQINTKKFLPPLDLMTGSPYNVPDVADDQYRMFLWDYPTLEAWNAMKIEGTNETTGKSKNFIQNKILGALDFSGSALETLLVSTNTAFVVPPKVAPVAAPGAAGPLATNMAMPDMTAAIMPPPPPPAFGAAAMPDSVLGAGATPITPEAAAALRPAPEPIAPVALPSVTGLVLPSTGA